MTFLALCAADIFYSYAIHLATFQILMEFFVYTVKAVSFKIHLGCAVTIDTPAHCQRSKLFYFIHLCNISVTGLALYLTDNYVLGVVKINMIW